MIHALPGGLVLGHMPEKVLQELPEAVTAPRSRDSPFYNLHIEGIKFGEEALNIDHAAMELSYGTIVDSGTTFTYLPSRVHAAFVGAFSDALAGLGYSLHEDAIGNHCFTSCVLQAVR